RLEIKRLIADAAKTVAPRLQQFALHVRRGRDDADSVARAERARFDARFWGSGRHLKYFVVPSEAKDRHLAANCRSLASLGMTIRKRCQSRTCCFEPPFITGGQARS